MTHLSKLMDMRGRCVLISGATGYLGQIMAETLAELGADLILVDLPGSNFHDLEMQLSDAWDVKVFSLECDLESEKDRDSMVASVKSKGSGISCLINNAAFVGSSTLQGWATPFEAQTIDTWRRAFEVNLTATFHLCQSFAPELRASTNGSIINIASIYGEFGPDWGLYEGTTMGNPAAYSASKGGLLQLTRWLSTTMAPLVRVNAISPGGIFRNQPAQFVDRYVAKTPLGRMATEDDFRGVVTYLAITRRQDAPAVFDMATVAYVVRPQFVLHQMGTFSGRVRAVKVGLHVFVHHRTGTHKGKLSDGDTTNNGAVRAKGCAFFHQGIAVFVLAFNQ